MSHRPPKDFDEQARQAAAKLTAHRGMATWGEKLVPLAAFRGATAKAGSRLAPAGREEALRSYTAKLQAPTTVEVPYSRIAVFGGVYNNHQALARLLEDASRRGAEAIYCLRDLGRFGPNPAKDRPHRG